MNNRRGDLAKQSGSGHKRRAAIITTAIVAVSSVLTLWIMAVLSGALSVPSLVVAIVTPKIVGVPLLFYILHKHLQLRTANKRLHILSTTDWLTACLNRGAFTERVVTDLGQVAGNELVSVALLVIDADNFKSVNDRFGHLQGDAALQLIAQAIRTNVRSTDVVGRLGGEEFGVYLHDANAEIADQIAQRIRLAVAKLAFSPDGQSCPLSVSIGAAAFNKPTSFEQIYGLADQRLFGAKRAGRNRVGSARPEDQLSSPTATSTTG